MVKDRKADKKQTGKSKSSKSVAAIEKDELPAMSKSESKQVLYDLQVELVKLQDWVKATGAKICVVFEGRDTAGKGGTIKRMTARVSPASFQGRRIAGSDRATEIADVHPAVHRAFSRRR